jgi:hypothetical protein
MLANIGAPAVPFFALVLTGAPAALTTLAFAGLFGFLAIQWVQLKKSAWWTALLLHIFVGITGAVSLATGDIGAVYAKMNTPQEQVQAMQLDTLTRNPMLWIFAAAVWLAYLAILLRVRRYFDAPDPRTRAGDEMLAATT